jgi:hypothetical protein
LKILLKREIDREMEENHLVALLAVLRAALQVVHQTTSVHHLQVDLHHRNNQNKKFKKL